MGMFLNIKKYQNTSHTILRMSHRSIDDALAWYLRQPLKLRQ